MGSTLKRMMRECPQAPNSWLACQKPSRTECLKPQKAETFQQKLLVGGEKNCSTSEEARQAALVRVALFREKQAERGLARLSGSGHSGLKLTRALWALVLYGFRL